MLALGSSLAAVVPHCEHVVEYSSLTGEISVGGDAGYAACGWHIQPNRRLQRIAFLVNQTDLAYTDQVAFFSHAPQMEANLVGLFSSHNTPPREMELRGSDEALIILHPTVNLTIFRMRYDAVPTDEIRFFSHYLSPLSFVMCVALLLLLSCACCALPVGMLCWRRMSRDRVRTIEASELLRHAELLQRRLGERAERMAQDEATEAKTSEGLAALPTQSWSSAQAAGSLPQASLEDECCLCMERFTDDDEVLLLPCKHFFHKPCIGAPPQPRNHQRPSPPRCPPTHRRLLDARRPMVCDEAVHGAQLSSLQTQPAGRTRGARRGGRVWCSAAAAGDGQRRRQQQRRCHRDAFTWRRRHRGERRRGRARRRDRPDGRAR